MNPQINMAIPISPLITAIPIEQDVKRKPNFTDAEKSFLITQYEIYKPFLSAKGNDMGTFRRKSEIWAMITYELNAQNQGILRTVKDVKKKWENLATQSRKELADFRQNQGSAYAAPPSAMTLKVLELLDDIQLQRHDEEGQKQEPDQIDESAGLPIIKDEIIDDGQTPVIQSVSSLLNSAMNVTADPGNPVSDPDPVPGHVEDHASSGISSRSSSPTFEHSSSSFSFQKEPVSSIQVMQPHQSEPPRKRRLAKRNRIAGCTCTCSNHSSHGSDELEAISHDIKKMKRLKIQLETEKLMLEKKKLELEIRYLTKKVDGIEHHGVVESNGL